MRITENLLVKVQMLDDKFKKHGERLTRDKIQSELSITSGQARSLKELIDNNHLVKPLPQKILNTVDLKALVIADLHIPYHNCDYIELALSVAESRGVNTIIILGDLLDMYKVSRFCKDPKKRNIEDEIHTAKIFLQDLRKRFPSARIIFKTGNHDERLEKYVFDKAPELAGLLEHLLEEKLELEKLNIEYIRNFFKIGKLWYIHGHEPCKGGGVNICDTIFKVILDHFMTAHFHQQQSKPFKRIDKTIYNTFSIGWLANDEAGDYAPLNRYMNGFAIVEYDTAGNFQVENLKIYEGQIYK